MITPSRNEPLADLLHGLDAVSKKTRAFLEMLINQENSICVQMGLPPSRNTCFMLFAFSMSRNTPNNKTIRLQNTVQFAYTQFLQKGAPMRARSDVCGIYRTAVHRIMHSPLTTPWKWVLDLSFALNPMAHTKLHSICYRTQTKLPSFFERFAQVLSRCTP